MTTQWNQYHYDGAMLRSCALRLMVPAAELYAHNLRHTALLHGDAVDHVGGLHHALGVRNEQELRLLAQRVQQVGEAAHVGFVECCVDFVERTERAWLELEDTDEQRQRGKRLFAA